eukprot:6362526-Amphidinium_carterae.1
MAALANSLDFLVETQEGKGGISLTHSMLQQLMLGILLLALVSLLLGWQTGRSRRPRSQEGIRETALDISLKTYSLELLRALKEAAGVETNSGEFLDTRRRTTALTEAGGLVNVTVEPAGGGAGETLEAAVQIPHGTPQKTTTKHD